MSLKKLVLDFESTFDKEHSLTKMTTLQYIRDPRFDVLGCSIIYDGGKPLWLDAHEIATYPIDWENSLMIAHNCQFDGAVLNAFFGLKPRRYMCTIALARGILQLKDNRLKTLAPLLGLGEKGNGLTMGAQASDQELIDYALQDAILCEGLYDILNPYMPEAERELIHITTRWHAEPVLILNEPMLIEAKQKAVVKRNALIHTSGLEEGVLTSNQQFANHLKSLGLTIPMKISPTTKLETYALAKGDSAFHAMIAAHPEHKDLWEGRLAAKSNIEINRPQAFLDTGSPFPMPLNYYGAHTGRWSGSDGLNVQNLMRKSAVRESLTAPKGMVVIVADSSQIELRINAWFSGEQAILNALYNDEDVYKLEASRQFKIDINAVSDDQRQFGKVCLAEGTLILTDIGLIPIEKINKGHKVWDGIMWVTHNGIVDNGIQEVITYDNITATPEHIVFTESGRKIPIRIAASQMDRIISSGNAKHPIRIAKDHITRDTTGWGEEIQADSMRVPRNQTNKMDRLHKCNKGKIHIDAWKWEETPTPQQNTGETVQCDYSPMQQPQKSRLHELWGAGYSMLLLLSRKLSRVHSKQPTSYRLFGDRDRPNKQQWKLREGEHPIGNQTRKLPESKKLNQNQLPGEINTYNKLQQSLHLQRDKPICPSGLIGGGNNQESSTSCGGETQKLEGVSQKVRVYDILNAGPNHRFTANGKLVSNCQLGLGYGMGWRKFKLTCGAGPLGMAPILLSNTQAEDAVTLYRENNPYIVQAWKLCEAVLPLLVNPDTRLKEPTDLPIFMDDPAKAREMIIRIRDEKLSVIDYMQSKGLGIEVDNIRLPNGMALSYPNLEGAEEGFRFGHGKHLEHTYGAKLQENIIQALARIVMAEQLLEIERLGIQTVSTTHDEIIAIAPESEAEATYNQMVQCMSVSPVWARDLKFTAKGGFAANYCK